MSRSVHASNKTQNIHVLGKAFIQKINNTTIYAENMYSPNFNVENKIFVLSCITMEIILICLSLVKWLLSLKLRIL